MKKCLAIFLATILLCGFAVAESSEDTAPDATFRGIPWGSTVQGTEALLRQELGSDISLKKGSTTKVQDKCDFGYFSNSYSLDYYN